MTTTTTDTPATETAKAQKPKTQKAKGPAKPKASKAKGTTTPKAKRVILNPQNKINAKTKAATEAGGSLSYANREWTLSKGKKAIWVKTAKDFSTETPETVKAALA